MTDFPDANSFNGRSPCGERGLKRSYPREQEDDVCVGGAWIETVLDLRAKSC